MNEDILLSVIIPVYNTEKYFERCIKSVIDAVQKNSAKSEIIVINDGSCGNIEELIKKYLVDYGNLIVYISQKNKGRGTTRNLGVAKARGKYINFVDSDDYIDENMYVNMFEKIKEERSDIVICDIKNVEKDNCFRVEAKNIKIVEDNIGCFDTMILPSCCNKIIRRELFDNVEFPEDINYEDLATIPYIYLKAKKISYLPEMLYNYVQNDESVMNEKFGINQLNLINALELVCDRIKTLNLSDRECQKFEYMIYTRRFYEELLEKIMLSENKKNLIKEFCFRIQNLERRFSNNLYFNALINSQRNIKRLGSKFLHKAIRKKEYKLLSIFLTKSLYYRYFAIRYTTKNIIEGE